MGREGERYDTAMVLGFLYHTGRQYEIIHKLAALDISAIIIDTAVLHNVTEPIVRLLLENTESEARLYSEGKTFDLSGIPSITAIHMMLKAAGFRPSLIVPTVSAARGGVNDYRGDAGSPSSEPLTQDPVAEADRNRTRRGRCGLPPV